MTIAAGDKIEISMRMVYGNQAQFNVWQYNVKTLTTVPTASALAEAWWNHVKATYRALPTVGYGPVFQSVYLTQLGSPTGDYAEYSVPVGERAGTRSDTAANAYASTFTAVGVRLAVGSRVTRPGQKRFGFITESDLNGNQVETAYLNLIASHMNVMSAEMVLGAPALGTVLEPYVVRKGADSAVLASQKVTGYQINSFVTSQVSRKQGRGI